LRNTNGKIVDSQPSRKCAIGDILQYRLGNGAKTHHTAVVAAVNSAGAPTAIYQQNYNSQRYVSRDNTDLNAKLKDRGGYILVYRPIAPRKSGQVEFTLVNNATSRAISFTIVGKSADVGAKNTSGGFAAQWAKAATVKLVVDGKSTTIVHRKGYEFYVLNGRIRLRTVSP
jgi:hypothetical protein